MAQEVQAEKRKVEEKKVETPLTDTSDDEGADSNEVKAMVGKPVEEIRLRKLMKEKLRTTTIPKLQFEEFDGTFYSFEHFYDFHKSLGCGSFGFVVSAVEKSTGDHMALKVLTLIRMIYFRSWMPITTLRLHASN
jgi:hypothetical protein